MQNLKKIENGHRLEIVGFTLCIYISWMSYPKITPKTLVQEKHCPKAQGLSACSAGSSAGSTSATWSRYVVPRISKSTPTTSGYDSNFDINL